MFILCLIYTYRPRQIPNAYLALIHGTKETSENELLRIETYGSTTHNLIECLLLAKVLIYR